MNIQIFGTKKCNDTKEAEELGVMIDGKFFDDWRR